MPSLRAELPDTQGLYQVCDQNVYLAFLPFGTRRCYLGYIISDISVARENATLTHFVHSHSCLEWVSSFPFLALSVGLSVLLRSGGLAYWVRSCSSHGKGPWPSEKLPRVWPRCSNDWMTGILQDTDLCFINYKFVQSSFIFKESMVFYVTNSWLLSQGIKPSLWLHCGMAS